MWDRIKGLFDSNAKEVKKIEKIVALVNAREAETKALTDEQLRERTVLFRNRLAEGETLDHLLPEAFAVVREASVRQIGLRHFDVQMIGGTALHQGRIAEMRTGEGKTLVGTSPTYLNALSGKGVHIITVNDYLAKRDATWMGPIFQRLGLTVGCIQHDSAFLLDPEYEVEDLAYNHLRPCERREAYQADITYGTNNEFGFDYLRDNMALRLEDCVQRELNYAIVDEVDSILIDEARTPLIISGRGEKSTDQYARFAKIVAKMEKGVHYEVDEKAHSCPMTEDGVKYLEDLLGIKKPDSLYDDSNIERVHHANQALRAKELYKLDDEYVLKDDEIVIVDEHTGRLMFGRRYSDGLHQAIEAKEGVKVKSEDQTLATITFQNFFKLYAKVGGMTGTALTEEREFRGIYNLDVVVIPTNRPMIRQDLGDKVYKTEKVKFEAVVEEIVEIHNLGRPVLVGTRSIEKSELLGLMLRRKGIPHNVLNAKYHEKEAMIVAQAGAKGAVTIATNMAGRGVDIILGGNPPDPAVTEEVRKLGGLHIIGTERHESRRIDNQLRGRAGRQGDPGSSRFYVALEDELMRLFGSDKISALMDRFNIEEDVPIEHVWISKAIENAQVKVESHHFDIRKNVKEYDDVMNQQRKVIYEDRRKILEGEDLTPIIGKMVDDIILELVDTYCPDNVPPDEWDAEGLFKAYKEVFGTPPGEVTAKDLVQVKADRVEEILQDWAESSYAEKEKKLGEELVRHLERYSLLRSIDEKWIDHLCSMDMLREGIGLRAYGQKDPKVEYINEAFHMFENLQGRIAEETVQFLYRVVVHVQEGEEGPGTGNGASKPHPPPFMPQASAVATHTNREEAGVSMPTRADKKIGRNDLCPCGSGKKYKKCCGAAG